MYTMEDAYRDARTAAGAYDPSGSDPVPNAFALRFQNRALLASRAAAVREASLLSEALTACRRRLAQTAASLPVDPDPYPELCPLPADSRPSAGTGSSIESELRERLATLTKEIARRDRREDLSATRPTPTKTSTTPPPPPKREIPEPSAAAAEAETKASASPDPALLKEIGALRAALKIAEAKAVAPASETRPDVSDALTDLTKAHDAYRARVSADLAATSTARRAALAALDVSTRADAESRAAERAEAAKTARRLDRAVADVKSHKLATTAALAETAETRTALKAARTAARALRAAGKEGGGDLYEEIDAVAAELESLQASTAKLREELRRREADVERYASLRSEAQDRAAAAQSRADALLAVTREQRKTLATAETAAIASRELIGELRRRNETLLASSREADARAAGAENAAAIARESANSRETRVSALETSLREAEAARATSGARVKELESAVTRLRRSGRAALAEEVAAAAADDDDEGQRESPLDFLCSVAKNKKELSALVKAKFTKMYCTVCRTRVKDTILGTCYHMFCGACVSKNLESRRRKCAMCNASFGKGDVRRVY